VSVNRGNHWTFSISEGYCIKWFPKAKLVPWVKSVELTFDRFKHKEHTGPIDWSFDSRRRLPMCDSYDMFYWAGLAVDGKRHKYVRSANPLCSHFPTVLAIFVTVLPGTVHGRACETPVESARLSAKASLELCSTHATHLLEFSPYTGEDELESNGNGVTDGVTDPLREGAWVALRQELQVSLETKGQMADSRLQTADGIQQAADSRQQTVDSRQQAADSRQEQVTVVKKGRRRKARDLPDYGGENNGNEGGRLTPDRAPT
jgi:hypothetical protein